MTYLGSVHGTPTALRHMRPRNRGTIVQVGSALSYRAIPLQSAYCGAKFAIRGDSLRCELIHDRSGICLSMVQPPAHNTPQFDWARNKVGWRAQPVPPIHIHSRSPPVLYCGRPGKRRGNCGSAPPA